VGLLSGSDDLVCEKGGRKSFDEFGYLDQMVFRIEFDDDLFADLGKFVRFVFDDFSAIPSLYQNLKVLHQ
jgi:hypothetical protein